MRRLSLTLIGLMMIGCGSPPEAAEPAAPVDPTAQSAVSAEQFDEYQTLPPEQREAPPPAGETPAWSFPTVTKAALSNGLSLQVVERHTLPLIEIKLVVRSGQATDGDKTGTAVLAGEMLKVGGSGPYASRQLLNRIESLGSSLDVLTSRDATSLTLSVTSDRFEEAMELLGVVVREPRFDQKEFTKLRRREIDRITSSAKSDAAWAASMVMYKRLFGSADPAHPYASFDGSEADISKRQLWEIKQWVKTNLTPENGFLLVVGDVTLDRVKKASEQALAKWRGKAPKPLKFSTPSAPEGLHIVLVDRPKSSQADVRLATLGPERTSEDWVPVRVANQILGGGAAARLFLDVREKQSLAYSAYSMVEEVGVGPCPIVLKAGTQTAKAGLTLQALLQHASTLSAEPPNPQEVSIASQYLSDVFLVNVESASAVASLTARLGIFGLSDDYYDRYREAVRGANAQGAQAAFGKYVKPAQGLVVVAGDAERLATPLSHFGEVEIVDPSEGFKRVRTVPHDPGAKIELDRIDGT